MKLRKIRQMIELNRIYNEDCLKGMSILPDNSVDLVVTDPPYKIITGGNHDGSHSVRPKGILGKHVQLMQNIPSFEDWVSEIYRVLKDGTHCYVMTNFVNLFQIGKTLKECGFKIHNLLVWRKNNCTPSQYYMKNCEYVFFCRKGKAKWINNIGSSKTVHDFNSVPGYNKKHPTEKPTSLIEMYIKNSSGECDLVLDPFMGSGTTAIACMNTGRNFIGFELNKEYYDISLKRIKEHGEVCKDNDKKE